MKTGVAVSRILSVAALAAVVVGVPTSPAPASPPSWVAPPGMTKIETSGLHAGDVVPFLKTSVTAPPPGETTMGVGDGDVSWEEVVVHTDADGTVQAYGAGSTAPRSPEPDTPSNNPCNDSGNNPWPVNGWVPAGYEWYYKGGSTPGELTTAQAEDGLKWGVANMKNVNNNCGHGDDVSADSTYLGRRTDNVSLIGGAGNHQCNGSTDGFNMIVFGTISDGFNAYTCLRWNDAGNIYESDVIYDKGTTSWYVPGETTCNNTRFSLETISTHESGHVFGLDHVNETGHPKLTMSEYNEGPCQNTEASLGKGDWIGLESIY